MTEEHDRLEAVLALFQDRLSSLESLQVDESFSTDDPPGVGGPLHTLTISVNNTSFAVLGLTTQAVSPHSPGFIAYITRRARARKAPYLVLTNQHSTLLAVTPRRDGDALDIQRQYPSLRYISQDPSEPLSIPERNSLIELCDKFGSDLLSLQRDGQLDLVQPDADFFVDRLTRAVELLKPAVKSALGTKIGMDIQFARQMEEWALLQGIPADLRSPDFTEAVTRHAIYRLLGKIIFYQSLRRAAPQLPELDLSRCDTSEVLPRLRTCFARAHEIDYHAVFGEDLIDNLPFPAAASTELSRLVQDLNTRDFGHLPQDVVGAVFERLIPPEDRHTLGQYFTPEALVDLILAFCVRRGDDNVMDPTCGTGTFLIRAYDRLRTSLGRHDHNLLLSQLWGVDIAPFPAELATINLFRLQVGEPGNFPRILNEDFFNVVPGGEYRFPPLKAETPPGTELENGAKGEVDTPIPVFDAIVGNFPYINAAKIEQREKGYLAKIGQCLALDWLQTYPNGFKFKSRADANLLLQALAKSMDTRPFLDKAQPVISSNADLYVSLFWHAAAFLKPGGRMGIVTSNAWLDVGYGYELQRFLLDHFKIVAILESRCEPWFEQAAVNTVVTILERCTDPAERDAYPARFVKIKRKLAELIPWDMHLDSLNRWLGLNKLVQRVESLQQASEDAQNPITFEDDHVRVRLVRQGILRGRVENTVQTVKWGPYLRAPQVYFDLLYLYNDRFSLLRDVAPPARGGTTRINDFFYLNRETIRDWGIVSEYCLPLIKSPGETDTILINPDEMELCVFVCRKSKDELRKAGHIGTLHYIEWGEKQDYDSGVQQGMKWPLGPWVRDRKPGWYALPDSETHPSQIFFSQAFGNRHLHKYSPTLLIADCRLYFLTPKNGINHVTIASLINSSLVSLLTEIIGRVALGDGALVLKVEDARDYLLIPDPRKFDTYSQDSITLKFGSLLTRPIGTVFDEIHQPDRQAFDQAILSAMGLDPDHWLPLIYDGLSTLVRERTQLGQMRSQARRNRPQQAARRVVDEVLQDLLPDGPPSFPDGFLSPAAKAGAFREVPLPVEYLGHLWGREELRGADGKHFTVANMFELRYLFFSQASGATTARVPTQTVEVTRTVNNYLRYLRELREELYQTYFKRTFDQAAANRFVQETWRKYNLPDQLD